MPDSVSRESSRAQVLRRNRSRSPARSRSRTPLPSDVRRSIEEQHSGAHYHNAYSPMIAAGESENGSGSNDEIDELDLGRTMTSATTGTTIDEDAELGTSY